MIEIKNLKKNFGSLIVYDGFSLTLNDGEITAVMGDSGSGKTTLLNILAGLTHYDGEINGLPEKKGYIFQTDRLIPHMTVRKNLELVATPQKVEEYIAKVGLSDFIDEYPKRLSAGMSRRIAVLRAFLYDAPLLLMDEPFRNLDLSLKYKIMDFFKSINEAEKRTAVFVTHDIEEAVYLADRVVVIRRGGEILFDEKTDKNQTENKLKRLFLDM